jgi:hypothetical protein
MEFYIPLAFFDEQKKYAVDYSSYIETLGLFYAGIFENGNFKKYEVTKHPYQIKMYVYNSSNEVKDFPQEKGVPCKVLRYHRGMKVMDAKVIQDSQNSLQYLDIVMDGKIPKSIPYDKTAELWTKNQRTNNVGFGVRSEVEEMVLSLNYRNPKDLSQTFASLYGSDLSISANDYETVGIRQICQYASTFSSITFEDMDTMITTSINRARKKGKETFSPVEETIKM